MLSAISEHVKGSPFRFGLLVAAVLFGASVAFGAVEWARPGVEPATTSRGVAPVGPPGPTVAYPLGAGEQVSMSAATATFGSALPLPTTSAVQPSDAGPVWAMSLTNETAVAITFPSKGMFVEYIRPAPYADPASGLKALSANFPSTHLMQLNGTTPALYFPGNDGSGLNGVLFQIGGTEVRVAGHDNEATLEAIAESILAQSKSSTSS